MFFRCLSSCYINSGIGIKLHSPECTMTYRHGRHGLHFPGKTLAVMFKCSDGWLHTPELNHTHTRYKAHAKSHSMLRVAQGCLLPEVPSLVYPVFLPGSWYYVLWFLDSVLCLKSEFSIGFHCLQILDFFTLIKHLPATAPISGTCLFSETVLDHKMFLWNILKLPPWGEGVNPGFQVSSVKHCIAALSLLLHPIMQCGQFVYKIKAQVKTAMKSVYEK